MLRGWRLENPPMAGEEIAGEEIQGFGAAPTAPAAKKAATAQKTPQHTALKWEPYVIGQQRARITNAYAAALIPATPAWTNIHTDTVPSDYVVEFDPHDDNEMAMLQPYDSAGNYIQGEFRVQAQTGLGSTMVEVYKNITEICRPGSQVATAMNVRRWKRNVRCGGGYLITTDLSPYVATTLSQNLTIIGHTAKAAPKQ